jgi:rsbT antagonist protein RsbS
MAEGRFVLTRIGQTLIVTLEGTADAATLSAAGDTIADTHARESAQSVVVDVSGCEVIDLDEFVGIQKLVRAVEWLGLICVLAGLRPGIVAYLASAGMSAGSLRTSLDLELALLALNSSHDQPEPEPQPEPEHETNDARQF